MRLMIDTNIFLDVMLCRRPFFDHSRDVLDLCEKKKAHGYISASCVSDIFYIVNRYSKRAGFAYRALDQIFEIAKVLTVTNDNVISAFIQYPDDFEDCLLAECAKTNKCDAIVTRNKEDFAGFGIPVLSPEDVVASIG